MPMDQAPPPARFAIVPTAQVQQAPWVKSIELARVEPDGTVRIDWRAVEQARTSFEPQLRHMAELLLAARHHRDKPLEHKK